MLVLALVAGLFAGVGVHRSARKTHTVVVKTGHAVKTAALAVKHYETK